MANETGLMVIPEPVKAELARRQMSVEQWNTLTNVLFPGASPASALMVWDYCQARRLDPFKKPVHIVPMRFKDVDGRYKTRDTVLPGIYEYRTTAQRTGEYMGKTPPVYGPNETVFGVTAPEWCEITVYRWNDKAKEKVPFTTRVLFKEACATRKKSDNDPTQVANDRWNRAPVQMLTKCTEAAALREAFPEEIGGVPTIEEIEGHMPDVVEGTVVGSDAVESAEERQGAPPLYEKVPEALRTRLEAAFSALKLSKAQALVKINEYIKADAVEASAETLLEWCKDEYARKQGTTRVKPDPNANDKGAAPDSEEALPVQEAEIADDDGAEDPPAEEQKAEPVKPEPAKVAVPAKPAAGKKGEWF